MAKPLNIAIVGPTASGKTHRAVAVAHALNAEIISADSRQVYRGMDLGTGKDLDEYNGIKYHLIDICDAGEKYNLYRFLTDFSKAKADIESRNKTALLCGGSGMYIEAALNGMIMPQVPQNHELREKLQNKSLAELTEILQSMKSLHNTTDVDTVKRALRAIEIQQFYIDNPGLTPVVSTETDKSQNLIIGISIPVEERRKRISQRLQDRLDNGMVAEVERLLNKGISPDDLIYYGLEYKWLTLYVIGRITFEEMLKSLTIAIHQFAKRQMTWFRGMERRGHTIKWLPYDMPDQEFISKIMECLEL